MSGVSQAAVKVKKKNLTVFQFFEKHMGKRTSWKQAPAKVWEESIGQGQVMPAPLVDGVTEHVKMLSPVGKLLCSTVHLPTDVLIASFTLLPKGVFNSLNHHANTLS